jgi:hypothetical protein
MKISNIILLIGFKICTNLVMLFWQGFDRVSIQNISSVPGQMLQPALSEELVTLSLSLIPLHIITMVGCPCFLPCLTASMSQSTNTFWCHVLYRGELVRNSQKPYGPSSYCFVRLEVQVWSPAAGVCVRLSLHIQQDSFKYCVLHFCFRLFLLTLFCIKSVTFNYCNISLHLLFWLFQAL